MGVVGFVVACMHAMLCVTTAAVIQSHAAHVVAFRGSCTQSHMQYNKDAKKSEWLRWGIVRIRIYICIHIHSLNLTICNERADSV